jgi:hypothetical protein
VLALRVALGHRSSRPDQPGNGLEQHQLRMNPTMSLT